MAVKNLLIRGGADFSGIKKEMAKTQKTLSSFQSNVSSAMKKIGIVLGTLAIGKLVKDSTEVAMNVESSMNQINRTMGANSSNFNKWVSEQAKGYGMAKSEAYKYGAVYSNLISGFTKDTSETTKYTEDLLKASAVVASATGRTMEDTMDRIRSGLLGNTESIEDLGINVNVAMIESTKAFQQFANGKSWQQLNFQTQQQIRLMAILEQANSKYGDSLANTTATQMLLFRAELKNVQLALGQAFTPILNVILPVLTALASKLAYVMNIVAQFSQALFGKSNAKQVATQSNAISSQASAMNDLGDATEKAGKQAKGSLAGFDEINSLADNSGSGGVGSDLADLAGGGGGLEPIPLNFESNAPEISSKIQDMANMVKSKVKEITDAIKDNKEKIISAISGIVGAFVTFGTLTFLSTIPEMMAGVGVALSALSTPILVTSAIIGALVAVFLDLYQTNEKFRSDINKIWNDIGKTFQGFWDNTLKPIGSYIINGFIKPIAESFERNIVPVLADMFIGASKIFNDLVKLLQSTIDNLMFILKPAMDLIKSVITDTLEIIKKLWDKHGQDLIENIRIFIKGVQDTFQLLWDNVLKPIIQPFLEMLSWLWTEHLSKLVEQIGDFIMKCVDGASDLYNGFIKPIIDALILEFGPAVSNVVAFVLELFGSMLAGISDIIGGLIKVLGGIIDFVVGVFTVNWQKAWEGVRDIFGGIFDSLVGLVKVPLNYIIDAINAVIRGLNSISIDIPDWVPTFGGKTFGISIPKIPKLAKGGITNGPTLAMIGDNPGGKEVVSPLSDLKDMIASSVGTAVMSAMQFGKQSTKQGDLILQIDGITLGRIIGPLMDEEKQRIGSNLIIQAT